MILSPVIRQLALDVLMHLPLRQSANRTAGYGLFALAGGIGIIGVVFLAIAAYGLLLESFPMPQAAALTGAGILALACIIAGVGHIVLKKIIRVRLHREKSNLGTVLDEAMKVLLDDLETPIRENPKTAIALAGLAGFMAGEKIH